MEPLANLNGRILPLAEAMVPAMDRGFLFGDAVYEGIRVYGGRPWLIERHMERLARSLREIRLAGVDLQRLEARMHETIEAGPFEEAFVYVQISRGVGRQRTHYFPANAAPTEFLFVEEWRDPYGEMRRTGIQVITHADLRWKRCDIKTVNLLGNVLAAQAAREAGAQEALLFSSDGKLSEATRSSLFAVMNACLITAPASPGILPGVTRNFVIELARRINIPVDERNLTLDELPRLQEVFLTGTGAEVLPVVAVDRTRIALGKMGPITQTLQSAYRQAVQNWLESP